MSVTSQAAVIAPEEVPHQSAETESHAHLLGNSHVLSWTIHGQSHDPSDRIHGSEVPRQTVIQNRPFTALTEPANSGHPASPVLDAESFLGF